MQQGVLFHERNFTDIIFYPEFKVLSRPVARVTKLAATQPHASSRVVWGEETKQLFPGK